MKKILLIALILFGGVNVYAYDNSSIYQPITQYAFVRSGYTKMRLTLDVIGTSNDRKTRIGGGSGVMTFGYGLNIGNNLRWDFEYSYNTPVKAGNTKTKISSYMFNSYYDVMNESNFKPFITAGIGIAKVYNDIKGVRLLKGGNFTYHAGVGSSYIINDDVILDFIYKFMDYSKNNEESLALQGIVETMNKAHVFTLGARFAF